MLIQSKFRIEFDLPESTPMVAMLNLHPSLADRMVQGDYLQIVQVEDGREMLVPYRGYFDTFGNRCSRFVAPAGRLRLLNTSLIHAADERDEAGTEVIQHLVQDLPDDVLQFLLPSRYCEADLLSAVAYDLFSTTKLGWERVTAIRDWVHEKVRFDYQKARPTKTAMDVFTEREGVCRDFQHLAVAMTRAMNIPARYATGYLGDIRIPASGPGDFSAWYQVYLGDRWWSMDARHNEPRYGRVLMATGRDAADVAITTSFGHANLAHFAVDSYEVDAEGVPVPLPGAPQKPVPQSSRTQVTVAA